MTVTYLLAAHHQPELFGRLAARVGASGPVVAHIDAKADLGPFRQAAPDVVFTTDRARVSWGGFSNVEMMLALLRDGLAASPTSTHLIHLSGVDYPVRPAVELESLLAADPARSYLNFYRVVPGAKFHELTTTFHLPDRVGRLPTRMQPTAATAVRRVARRFLSAEFPASHPPFRGSISSCLSRAAAQYVVDFVASPDGAGLLARLRTMMLPDEFVIQTILCNSPLRSTLAGWPEDDVTGIREDDENKVSLHYIDWSPGREDPAILVLDDLSAIRDSRKYFARKMDAVRSGELLDALDRECDFEPREGQQA